MNNPLISIIIPVYNSEKYLKVCLDSVINQTYNNLEIIIINDGSTDNSLEIIKSYKDTRIKLINKENGGVSSARNVGLKQATGEYIMFVDSDDYILDNHEISKIVNYFEESEFYIISNKNRTETKNIKINKRINKQYLLRILQWDSSRFLNDVQYISGVTCKVYVNDIIKKNLIKFDEELTMGEDTIFNLLYFKHINSFKIINIFYYCTNSNKNSITRSINKNIANSDIYYQKRLEPFLIENFIYEDLEIAKYRASLGGIITSCDSYFFKGDISKYLSRKKELKEFILSEPYKSSLNNIIKTKEYLNIKNIFYLYLIKNKLFFLAYLAKKISTVKENV